MLMLAMDIIFLITKSFKEFGCCLCYFGLLLNDDFVVSFWKTS